MKKTSLFDIHVESNAKMVSFAGFNMPVQFEGVNTEHLQVRNSVGIFDVSHMGEFLIEGDNATEFLNYICSNDILLMSDGKAQYNCIINHNGGIIDDSIVYKFDSKNYMIVVNASNIDKDWDWISSHNDLGVTMENRSDEYSLLAIQGPKAVEAMQSLSSIDLSQIAYYHFEVGDFAGFNNVIISATGYTGSGGFEIYCKNEQVEAIWNKVFEAGATFDIKPIGLAARDTLRLEMGFCLYGNDINDTTSPLEAGLGWITKFTKEFTNSENLKKQKENGVARKLIAFEMQERSVPRHYYEIVDSQGNVIGIVTSGTMSPSMNVGIGLGYVPTSFSALDSDIYIRIRKNDVPAKVVKLPFYKK